MDIILHIGAHRTASTSFQSYMQANEDLLTQTGVEFWGPRRTRGGVLSGVISVPGVVPAKRQMNLARGRIATQIENARSKGMSHLIVSDENMIGAPRHNLRARTLYGAIGARLAQFHHAFDGKITRISFSIRSLDRFWTSTMAYGVNRGHAMPDASFLDEITVDSRSWRDVITDVACAMPNVDIQVMPFETFAGRPEEKLAKMTDSAIDVPMRHRRKWLNRGPDLAQLRQISQDRGTPTEVFGGEGRWHPFSPTQTAILREKYQDDLYWLYAGADGLARLTEETSSHKTGYNPAGERLTKGQDDDIENGRVA